MFKKFLKIAGLLALVIFIIGTLAFSSYESKDVLCRSIEVDYSLDEVIQIDKNEIIRLVKGADNKILSKKLNQINAETIEKAIEKHDAIINAEVYKVIAKDTGSFRGILTVKVKHREPVLRVMSNDGNYYLDEFGGKIPTSLNYSANVLAATGLITEDFAKTELLPFVLYVENDDFWRAQIEQIHVESDGEILLTPLVGEHFVEFGELDDYQKKLEKMKAFYQQVLAKNNWNKYKSISLKYKDQVIAKKR